MIVKLYILIITHNMKHEKRVCGNFQWEGSWTTSKRKVLEWDMPLSNKSSEMLIESSLPTSYSHEILLEENGRSYPPFWVELTCCIDSTARTNPNSIVVPRWSQWTCTAFMSTTAFFRNRIELTIPCILNKINNLYRR